MCINSLKVSKYTLEENLLYSSHRAQVAENNTKYKIDWVTAKVQVPALENVGGLGHLLVKNGIL